jgi:uncharacterized protein (DUF1501 family)
MDLHNSVAYTRREFLQGLTLASAALAVPSFLQSSALGLPSAMAGMSSIPGVPEDHILVVVQLSGGNDGLNTVVPYGFPEYYKARTGIGIPQNQVLKLSGAGGGEQQGVGLHPQMTAMKEMYDEGLLAVVQGVGYPNPNRSHFKSMDIWQTADTTGTGNGWIGRYMDSECCGYGKGESGSPEPATESGGDTAPGIAIGRTAPLAMEGQKVKPVAFENADLFRWTAAEINKGLGEEYDQINRRGLVDGIDPKSNAAFLMKTALDAQISSDLIRKAVAQKPLVQYPGNDLARQLTMVASMIRAGLKTRVYYVNHGGFDTHAGQGGQNGRHGQLLNQLASAMKAFYADLKAQGNDGRVLAMSFSEFGRRVTQNASQGTDHGTAAPMFLFGPQVVPGVHGEHPSLSDLDQGDLKYKIDFRSVYAGILEGWLKADSRKILEGTYAPAKVIKVAQASGATR